MRQVSRAVVWGSFRGPPPFREPDLHRGRRGGSDDATRSQRTAQIPSCDLKSSSLRREQGRITVVPSPWVSSYTHCLQALALSRGTAAVSLETRPAVVSTGPARRAAR